MKRYIMSRTKGKVLCISAMHPTRRRINRQQAAPGPAPRRLRGATPMVPGLIYDGAILDGSRVMKQQQPSVEQIVGRVEEV